MFTLQPNVTHGNIVGLVHPLSGHHIQPRSKFMAVEEPEFSIPHHISADLPHCL